MQYFGASLLTLLGLASSLQCTEVNGGHNTWSREGRVRLEVHPSIEEWLHNGPGKKLVLHKKNEPLNMTCSVVYQNGEKEDKTPLDYTVDWKMPRHINNNPKIVRGQSRNTAWIWFERLAEIDAGDYTCIAVSAKASIHQSTLSESFYLFVEHKPKYCGSEWFTCRSKNCIMERYLCDGKRDCEEGEDESPAAGCGPDPCYGKIYCEDRCVPPEWCCDHHNCSGTFGLGPWPHENGEISYVQTAFYTVIGCAMAFMFIVTILVIAICRVQIKRAMNSRCSQQNRNGCTRRTVPLYDLDVYLNRTTDMNYGVSIMYNINRGVQFVGRPAEPPPYSEVVAEPPHEGPPPPYKSCENLIVRQTEPRFLEEDVESALRDVSASLPDGNDRLADTDIRGSARTSSRAQRENSLPNVPGPQVATHSSSAQLSSINSRDSNTTAFNNNRDSVDGASIGSGAAPSRANLELEYVETDALLAENCNGLTAVEQQQQSSKRELAWKPYSRHALIKSRWLNGGERGEKNPPEKHWYRIEKAAPKGSLKDSENEGVFLDTDQQQQQQQQDSITPSSSAEPENAAARFPPPFVNIVHESNSSGEHAGKSSSHHPSAGNKKKRIETKIDTSRPTTSQKTTDKKFLVDGIKRQSSLTIGDNCSKKLGESSASASTGSIDSPNCRVDDKDDVDALVLPLRESFIGVQRDS